MPSPARHEANQPGVALALEGGDPGEVTWALEALLLASCTQADTQPGALDALPGAQLLPLLLPLALPPRYERATALPSTRYVRVRRARSGRAGCAICTVSRRGFCCAICHSQVKTRRRLRGVAHFTLCFCARCRALC